MQIINCGKSWRFEYWYVPYESPSQSRARRKANKLRKKFLSAGYDVSDLYEKTEWVEMSGYSGTVDPYGHVELSSNSGSVDYYCFDVSLDEEENIESLNNAFAKFSESASEMEATLKATNWVGTILFGALFIFGVVLIVRLLNNLIGGLTNQDGLLGMAFSAAPILGVFYCVFPFLLTIISLIALLKRFPLFELLKQKSIISKSKRILFKK